MNSFNVSVDTNLIVENGRFVIRRISRDVDNVKDIPFFTSEGPKLIAAIEYAMRHQPGQEKDDMLSDTSVAIRMAKEAYVRVDIFQKDADRRFSEMTHRINELEKALYLSQHPEEAR